MGGFVVSSDSSNEKMEDTEDYKLLKDLKVKLKSKHLKMRKNDSNQNGSDGNDKENQAEDGSFCFSLCFWLYLTDRNSSPFPCTILHQEHPDIPSTAPFLLLDDKRNMMLFPLHLLHQEAPSPTSSIPWTEVPCAWTQDQFPMEKWVHIGCEVSPDFMRLHVNGDIVGEKPLTSSVHNNLLLDSERKESMFSFVGDGGGLQGYIHHVVCLPSASLIKSHHMKEPPIQLSVDTSSASEIEEDSDSVWSIVGGKASCRRNFSLDVILLDAFCQPVNKELEVVASLVYADDRAPVENSNDGEAPLLSNYDGIEYASSVRPCKLINGRASFRLKISQLSSKCDYRLFRIKFNVSKGARYPFLEAFSLPIRCISRSRNPRTSALTWKKLPSGVHSLNDSQSPASDDGSPEVLHNIVREAKPSPSSKRIKLGQGRPFSMLKDDILPKKANWDREFHACTIGKDDHAKGASLEDRSDNREGDGTLSSGSENTETENTILKSMPINETPISDLSVFKYCLGSPSERALMLKEIAASSSQETLASFAEQVSLISGCSHHRRQITITKKLSVEGRKAWNSISQNSHHVLWENLVSGLNEIFLKITCCRSRSLTHQDFELLRRIAGCKDLVSQENFDKIWFWIYPVAFTLSQDLVSTMWASLSPKWIEGFITKEEAEASLQGSGSTQDPGTFVLRFPTSRSWPHPDAGSLVVTFVGSDYSIHHRLLSLDMFDSSDAKELKAKPLQEMLLDEPELSRLGRITRRTW